MKKIRRETYRNNLIHQMIATRDGQPVNRDLYHFAGNWQPIHHTERTWVPMPPHPTGATEWQSDDDKKIAHLCSNVARHFGVNEQDGNVEMPLILAIVCRAHSRNLSTLQLIEILQVDTEFRERWDLLLGAEAQITPTVETAFHQAFGLNKGSPLPP